MYFVYTSVEISLVNILENLFCILAIWILYEAKNTVIKLQELLLKNISHVSKFAAITSVKSTNS